MARYARRSPARSGSRRRTYRGSSRSGSYRRAAPRRSARRASPRGQVVRLVIQQAPAAAAATPVEAMMAGLKRSTIRQAKF